MIPKNVAELLSVQSHLVQQTLLDYIWTFHATTSVYVFVTKLSGNDINKYLMMLMAFNTFDKICWKYFATKNNTLYMFNNITYCPLTKNIQYNTMLSHSLYYIHFSGWVFLLDVYVIHKMKTIRRKLTFRNWPQNHIACYKDNQLYPWKLISICYTIRICL